MDFAKAVEQIFGIADPQDQTVIFENVLSLLKAIATIKGTTKEKSDPKVELPEASEAQVDSIQAREDLEPVIKQTRRLKAKLSAVSPLDSEEELPATEADLPAKDIVSEAKLQETRSSEKEEVVEDAETTDVEEAETETAEVETETVEAEVVEEKPVEKSKQKIEVEEKSVEKSKSKSKEKPIEEKKTKEKPIEEKKSKEKPVEEKKPKGKAVEEKSKTNEKPVEEKKSKGKAVEEKKSKEKEVEKELETEPETPKKIDPKLVKASGIALDEFEQETLDSLKVLNPKDKDDKIFLDLLNEKLLCQADSEDGIIHSTLGVLKYGDGYLLTCSWKQALGKPPNHGGKNIGLWEADMGEEHHDLIFEHLEEIERFSKKDVLKMNPPAKDSVGKFLKKLRKEEKLFLASESGGIWDGKFILAFDGKILIVHPR